MLVHSSCALCHMSTRLRNDLGFWFRPRKPSVVALAAVTDEREACAVTDDCNRVWQDRLANAKTAGGGTVVVKDGRECIKCGKVER